LFHLALGNEDGGVQLVYESACCLAWGFIFDRRKDRGVVCVFSIFNAGGSVCVCMFVYTHTHTHTAQMGCSDVSPGVGMRHLEGPKKSDGLNLGIHIFVYVYKVHMCIYMLRGGMRSWTNEPSVYIHGTRWSHGCGAHCTQVWVVDTRRGGGTPG